MKSKAKREREGCGRDYPDRGYFMSSVSSDKKHNFFQMSTKQD